MNDVDSVMAILVPKGDKLGTFCIGLIKNRRKFSAGSKKCKI